ncbi:APC family permease [Williamsia muralis]|uniref:APC family permease n=1 Tax=Williamsia marianensis TaxID=85044 RepID=UPI00380F74F2
MNNNALRAALAHAQQQSGRPDHPVRSPLSALGRRQLTPMDLLGQSMSTMAPATCMVYIALWTATYSSGLTGLLTIAGVTIVMTLVAVCISQFTARLAAAGSLYSFVAQGLGKRATLTAGTALLMGYLGVSISVLWNSGSDLLALGLEAGLPISATRTTVLAICIIVAVVVAMVAIRGVRFAARTILVIETCSLILIVALLMRAPVAVEVTEPAHSLPVGFMIFLAMQTVMSMAGFESAAFFGPEARRPLRTVTRTVLLSPIIIGVLYVFAAWAGMSGHAGTLLNAYFGGTASGAHPLLVAAVNIGVCCSWLASTLGCVQAGSRLLFAMGVDWVAPRALATVHPRFRTPFVAVTVFCCLSLAGAVVYGTDNLANNFDIVVEVALMLGYTLVSVAALRFLHRIGEHTAVTVLCGGIASVAGLALLLITLLETYRSGAWTCAVWAVGFGISGSVWYAVLRRVRPASIATIGEFDTVETADLLPGSAVLTTGPDGRIMLAPERFGP